MKKLFDAAAPLAIVALLAYQFAGGVAIPKPGPMPSPQPAPVVPAGAETLAAPIAAKASAHPAEARKVAAFYRAFADVVQRDTGKAVHHMAAFREAHIAGLLAISQGTPGQGTLNIGTDIDHAIKAHLGLSDFEPVPLDAATRQKLVEILHAIAGALE